MLQGLCFPRGLLAARRANLVALRACGTESFRTTRAAGHIRELAHVMRLNDMGTSGTLIIVRLRRNVTGKAGNERFQADGLRQVLAPRPMFFHWDKQVPKPFRTKGAWHR